MIKRRTYTETALILVAAMALGTILHSCSKKKPQEIIYTRPIPATPTLSSPPNRTTKEAPNPIFRWNSDYNQDYFTLQISLDSTFACSTVTESLTTYDYVSADLRKLSTYYWRVKAANSSGSSKWSSVWSFTTGPIEVIGSLGAIGFARDVAFQGTYCYVVTDSSLQVINIENPTAPVLVGSCDFHFYLNPRGYRSDYERIRTTTTSNYAYLTSDSGFYIINISNPYAPTLSGRYGLGPTDDMAVVGNYAYLLYGVSGQMEIIDISNPSSPLSSGIWHIKDYGGYWCWKGDCSGERAFGMAVANNYAYLSTTYGMDVVDVATPAVASLVFRDTSGLLSGGRLAVAGSNYLYVINQGGKVGIGIINISNPTAPNIESNYKPQNSYINNISAVGSYAYIGSSGSYYSSDITLEITDITNPFRPVFIGKYYGASNATGNGNFVYAATGRTGLKILQITP